ncbi:hypothetical protein [Microbacterium hydrocarbonoxydans]|uniref:hypothetical protein n=1 Tax=Microbacterium hydrocarbonoxydans TaxID=273678 RepID=UPI00203CE3A6|nr:hypothetical protein [Microbacterium hydrocarbonoxydans]MCM3779879.1 hypothetical protein [Microbacterium hydrocarbonoxydans]
MPESAASPQHELERLVRRVVREELQALVSPRVARPTGDEDAIETTLEFLERIDPLGKLTQEEARSLLLVRFPHLFLR